MKTGRIPWNKGQRYRAPWQHHKGPVGYQAYHERVRVARGTPSKCEHCNTTEPRRYEWANLTGKYEDINDYIRLCTPCHRKMDSKGVYNFSKLKPRNCLLCGKIFAPTAGMHRRCGKRTEKGSCTAKHFNEYHRLRMKRLYANKQSEV